MAFSSWKDLRSNLVQLPHFSDEEPDPQKGRERNCHSLIRGGTSARPNRKSEFQGPRQNFQSSQENWDCFPQLLSPSRP